MSGQTTATIIIDRRTLRLIQIGWWSTAVATTALFIAAWFTQFSANTLSPETIAQLTQTTISIPFYSRYISLLALFRALAFLLVTAVIYWHRPNDWSVLITSIGLLTRGVGVTLLMREFADSFPVWELAVDAIFALGNIVPLWVFLIFPNGRFWPRWTRYLLVFIALFYTSWYIMPPALSVRSLPAPIWEGIDVLIYFGALFIQMIRYRRQNPTQQQQMKWLLFGVTVGVVIAFGTRALVSILTNITNPSATTVVTYQLFIITAEDIAFLLIPITLAISVLRYRLWEINFVISRALVYGTLTAVLALIFLGCTLLLSRIATAINSGQQSIIALAFATLLLGAFFQPARRQLQRFVDRRFFGIELNYQQKQKSLPDIQDVVATAKLGEYQIDHALGHGGMAEVFKATHPNLSEPIALKVLHPHLSSDDTHSRRFIREAEVGAKLRHPHLVPIFDFGQEDETYFIVMAYIEGNDLRTYLSQNGRLSLADTYIIINGIAQALDYMHTQGIVHRDVKPSNVILQAEKRPLHPMLTDFGVVKYMASEQTQLTRSGVLGTFDYMSPEQIQTPTQVNGRADIYALGVLAYQLLTGQLPFTGRHPGATLMAHVSQPPPDASMENPDLPFAVGQAIIKAMDKRPERRYATATTFAQTLAPA